LTSLFAIPRGRLFRDDPLRLDAFPIIQSRNLESAFAFVAYQRYPSSILELVPQPFQIDQRGVKKVTVVVASPVNHEVPMRTILWVYFGTGYNDRDFIAHDEGSGSMSKG
jgi:hypothetical protein